jgi:diaminohydroxyphosphoribosylaminopyrimidine deaminase/5-amino-6-(5-phosphoribosylamino)uracil reductase
MDIAEPPMRRALELARQAWGKTHPNPMVGAVITENGKIVAEGYHAKAGEPHAEVMALRALGRSPSIDAILHVTLEPCCTHGRTPPCVDAIIKSGVRTVVVGALDPNPLHAGKGLQILREKGIQVVEGILAEECTALNLIFNHWITEKRPLVALKVASTLDGKLVLPAGQGKRITSSAADAEVHQLRKLYPAIAVSAATLLADNSRLTARTAAGESCGYRFVLDRHFRTAGARGMNVFQDAFASRTIVVGLAQHLASANRRWYEAEGIAVWELPGDETNFWKHWQLRLAQESITGVLVEAGPRLAGEVLRQGLADYLYAFVAPRISGVVDSPAWFEGVDQSWVGSSRPIGPDTCFEGFLP